MKVIIKSLDEEYEELQKAKGRVRTYTKIVGGKRITVAEHPYVRPVSFGTKPDKKEEDDIPKNLLSEVVRRHAATGF